jgi:hypothetical protein
MVEKTFDEELEEGADEIEEFERILKETERQNELEDEEEFDL